MLRTPPIDYNVLYTVMWATFPAFIENLTISHVQAWSPHFVFLHL